MTGSAFPMHIGRGTLCNRLAPQDIYNYRKLREQKGVRRASERRLADDGKRLSRGPFRRRCLLKLEGVQGERARDRRPTRGLADDGKRLCDLIAARNVVIRLAPQDNLHQY